MDFNEFSLIFNKIIMQVADDDDMKIEKTNKRKSGEETEVSTKNIIRDGTLYKPMLEVALFALCSDKNTALYFNKFLDSLKSQSVPKEGIPKYFFHSLKVLRKLTEFFRDSRFDEPV